MGRINMSVDAVGMDEIIGKLEMMDMLGSRAKEALVKGAEVVLREAQANAPVRTGSLKAALKVGKRAKTGSSYAVEVGAFHGDAPHAHLVEHGHGGPHAAPAHPFLEPAAEATADEVTETVMAELMRMLD